MATTNIDLAKSIRDIPDFPKPGILFKDITTLLKDGRSLRQAVDGLDEKIGKRAVDVVVGMESRGFIFGAPIAYKRGVGFVPVRKLGKLPADVVSVEYDLEYGSATLEIGSIPGERSYGAVMPRRDRSHSVRRVSDNIFTLTTREQRIVVAIVLALLTATTAMHYRNLFSPASAPVSRPTATPVLPNEDNRGDADDAR